MYLIVSYDVPAKRTEKYRKLLACYLTHLQYSVFAGDLTEVVYRRLRQDINSLYKDTDHLVFIQTDNRRNIHVDILENGMKQEDTSHLGSAIV
ncbi:MAG TPA: CRISPR-associated endonuclease Cas2 [Gammaproteobacteria bacterium]|nr:CRISPR-associated endonuclease Cas2 [Gammaproteobacteria bacterium]